MAKRFRHPYRLINSRVLLTLLSPLGSYPEESLISGQGCIFVSDRLCFSALRFWRRSQLETYSEVDRLGSAEVRLLAAAMLAAKSHYVTIKPYPFYSLTVSVPPRTKISSRETRVKLGDNLLKQFKRQLGAPYAFPSEPLHAPPALGGRPYNTLQELDWNRCKSLLGSISLSDKLLIRGLGALLKANMLLHFVEFAEAAGMQLFVALEASFRLFLRELARQGVSSPTNVAAGNFIHNAFGVTTPAEGYFVEDYEKRIMTLHPERVRSRIPSLHIMHPSKSAKESVLVMSLALFLSTVAWSPAVPHGPLATAFLGGPAGNFVGDWCFYLSVPGWLLAVSIFGYESGASVLSQLVVVGANTMLYGIVVILILRAASFLAAR